MRKPLRWPDGPALAACLCGLSPAWAPASAAADDGTAPPYLRRGRPCPAPVPARARGLAPRVAPALPPGAPGRRPALVPDQFHALRRRFRRQPPGLLSCRRRRRCPGRSRRVHQRFARPPGPTARLRPHARHRPAHPAGIPGAVGHQQPSAPRARQPGLCAAGGPASPALQPSHLREAMNPAGPSADPGACPPRQRQTGLLWALGAAAAAALLGTAPGAALASDPLPQALFSPPSEGHRAAAGGGPAALLDVTNDAVATAWRFYMATNATGQSSAAPGFQAQWKRPATCVWPANSARPPSPCIASCNTLRPRNPTGGLAGIGADRHRAGQFASR